MLGSLRTGLGRRLSRGHGQQGNKEALEFPSLGSSKMSESSALGNGGTGVPLVVSYNLFLSRLGQAIHKNLCFLYQNKEVKQVFTSAHFVSSRSARTLRSHLVRDWRETSWVKGM